MKDKDLVSEINNALQVQNYDLSLELYARLFTENIAIDIARQHKLNAASLARKKLYDELSIAAVGISRLKVAIDTLIGLKPFSYENAKQQPNFFYIPGLTAKPFWELSDIPDLEGLCTELKVMLEASVKNLTHSDPYISDLDTVPESAEWDVLKKSWHQTVLLKGGQIRVGPDSAQYEVAQKLLQSPLVADCPPHAPEAFFSELSPGAYIPPHFGISNLKLTVHIPFIVNETSYISVADDVRRWNDAPGALIFDDSFIHEAKNDGDQHRVVFIFDVWHPELSIEERTCLKGIMQKHNEWNQQYGHLAALDQS